MFHFYSLCNYHLSYFQFALCHFALWSLPISVCLSIIYVSSITSHGLKYPIQKKIKALYKKTLQNKACNASRDNMQSCLYNKHTTYNINLHPDLFTLLYFLLSICTLRGVYTVITQ